MPADRWARFATLLLVLAPGCALKDYIWEPSPRPVGDSVILRTGMVTAAPSELSPELAAAHELYREEKISKAESAYHAIAENQKNPPPVAEEARFYEAECLYKQDKFPKACDTYHKMLIDFPNGTYRAQSVRRMFDIANYWLDDIRAEKEADKEKREGKRMMVFTPVVHFEKQKPFFDLEGRAMQALEQVHLNDIGGPLADKALFLAGGVKFYREDYKEADYYYSMIVEQHPNSPLAPQAIELAILSKHMSTGGSDYDARKVAEARLMIDMAVRSYPELASEKNTFLTKQMASINLQQAEKDYNTAEFYLRTGHAGAAFYTFEIVRRTYPTTRFAPMAEAKLQDIKRDVDAGKYTKAERDQIAELFNKWEGLFTKGGTPAASTPPPPMSSRPGGP